MFILALDQGTTNTKALIFNADGGVVSQASASCQTDYPQPGWAEQSAKEIWATTQEVIAKATQGIEADIAAIGISNQRETLVVWDAETGEPVGPAPIWQCRRTADECSALIGRGLSDEVTALTGLEINPLFPASKLAWVLQHRTEAAELHRGGKLRAGTVDAWLLWNLTGGAEFATDHSNASRTLLFDTARLEWSPRLGEIFGAPIDCLPRPMPSDARFGVTATGATSLPEGIPINAIMGDSHAALFGHGVRKPGLVKATYGTGTSLMALTDYRAVSTHGLSGTIAWTQGHRTSYALEGNITVSGQAASVMARLLGLEDAAALSELAESVEDSGGVHVVPAFAGLGAPHWDDTARGTITGMTLGTTPAHLARATFEAIAHQVADVFEAMEQDLGVRIRTLSADGGASANTFLMQLQSDILGCPVERPSVAEIGAYGVAQMAAEAFGGSINIGSKGLPKVLPADLGSERNAARSTWASAISKSAN